MRNSYRKDIRVYFGDKKVEIVKNHCCIVFSKSSSLTCDSFYQDTSQIDVPCQHDFVNCPI